MLSVLKKGEILKSIRYHLTLSNHRTTVSLEKTIAYLMALKLGAKPGTPEAHRVVRQKLDSFIERDRGRGGWRLGYYIAEQAVLFLVDKELSEKYMEHILDE